MLSTPYSLWRHLSEHHGTLDPRAISHSHTNTHVHQAFFVLPNFHLLARESARHGTLALACMSRNAIRPPRLFSFNGRIVENYHPFRAHSRHLLLPTPLLWEDQVARALLHPASIFPAQCRMLHLGYMAKARDYPNPGRWYSKVPSLLPPQTKHSSLQRDAIPNLFINLAWVAGEIGVSSFFPRFPPQPLHERFFIQYQIDLEYHPPKEYIL